MKLTVVLLMCAITGCATQHRESSQVLRTVYIDCTNRQSFENYYAKQLQLTDMSKITSNSDEAQYYSAIKDRLWTLRSTCPR